MALIGNNREDAAGDRREERVAVMCDDAVALHGELHDAGVVAQPYVTLSADVIQCHVGSVEAVG